MPACFSQVLTAQVNGENSIVLALTLSVVSASVFCVGANPSAADAQGLELSMARTVPRFPSFRPTL